MSTTLELADPTSWERIASRSFVPLECESADRDFHASLHRHSVEGVTVSRVRSSPLIVSRTPDLARQSNHDDVHLAVQVRATGSINQSGRRAVLTRGSAALYATNEPYILDHQTAEQDLYVLQIQRRLLGLNDREIHEAKARLIPASTPMLRALSTALGDFSAASAAAADAQAETALAIGHLTTAVLQSARGGTVSAPTTQEVLRRSAEQFIHDHAADSTLTVDDVAAAQHVSVRTLYAAFRATELSPGAMLRARRLALAQELLVAHDRPPTLDYLAQQCGFSDGPALGRAFKRDVGVPPIQWLESQQHRDQ